MQNFDHQFNVSSNFIATMDGMTESVIRFNGIVESTHNWLGKLNQVLAIGDLLSNYARKINDFFQELPLRVPILTVRFTI